MTSVAPMFATRAAALEDLTRFHQELGMTPSEAETWARQIAHRYGYEIDDTRPAMSTIGPSPIDRIKAAYSIEDLANRLTHMRWSGDRGRGPCPLHGGSNPSAFTVDIVRQKFTCFNCGQYGDVVDLYGAARERALI